MTPIYSINKSNLLLSTIVILYTLYSIFTISYVSADDNRPNADLSAQAIPVDVVVIEQTTTRLWKSFSGHLTAVEQVEIRPQVSGLITEIKFADGQFVNQGDILYVIDPRPLKAILQQKKANLIAAEDNYALAAKELLRTQDLLAQGMVSQQIYDERINAKLIAKATIAQIKAELAAAEINLDYAYLKAPISGRISRAELTKGNLVSTGINAPLLTTIVSSGQIYADFEIDEQTYLDYTIQDGSITTNTQHNPVELRLQNDNTIYQGFIHSFDNKIDPTAGTIRARALFDDPDEKLLPGMYARLKFGSASKHKMILVDERAIATNQNRKYVYVVNNDNIVNYREVTVGDSINGKRVIHSGLAIGDKVIVNGLMKIQANMQVEPIILPAIPNTKAQP